MQSSKIVEKILKEAEEQAKRILAKAEEEAKAILVDAEKEKNFIIDAAHKEAEEVYRKEKEKRIGLEVIELRKKVLAAKREIVDAVFKKVIDTLKTESADKYIGHMANFIKALDLNGKYEVIPGGKENRVNEEFIKKLGKETGLDLTLSKEKLAGYSGFTLKREKVEINLAPEVIIPEIKDEIEDNIKALLFEE